MGEEASFKEMEALQARPGSRGTDERQMTARAGSEGHETPRETGRTGRHRASARIEFFILLAFWLISIAVWISALLQSSD